MARAAAVNSSARDAQGRAGGVGGAAEAFVQRPECGVAGGADLGDDRGDGLGDVRGGGGAAVEGAEGGGEAGVVVAEECAWGKYQSRLAVFVRELFTPLEGFPTKWIVM